MRGVVVFSEVPKVLYLPPFITFSVAAMRCVCVFLEAAAPVRLCSIYSRTLKVSCRHILTKGRGTRGCPRVCVLMRDWHHARGASLAEECGSRQIDCSFTRSISPSTTVICLSLHCISSFCVVFIFYSLCVCFSLSLSSTIKERLTFILHFNESNKKKLILQVFLL